jgi:hypothetical protein
MLALLITGAAAAGIRTLDRSAFSLQPREVAEHEGGESEGKVDRD